MARGGIVDADGNCIDVTVAASGSNPHYIWTGKGWLAFVPDAFCNIGDRWNGSVFTYAAIVPPVVTQQQVIAAFNDAGFGTQLTQAIVGASAINKSNWSARALPNVTTADPVVTAAQTSAGLTATQLACILQSAQRYPAGSG